MIALLIVIAAVTIAACALIAKPRRERADDIDDAADRTESEPWFADVRDVRGTTWPNAKVVRA